MTSTPRPLPFEIRFNDGARALRIRQAQANEAEALMEAFDESVQELRAFLPWSLNPQSVEDQRARLADHESGRGPRGVHPYHLFEGPGDRLIGCVGWNTSRSLNPRAAEIGYWMRTSASGRGLMTLATQCMVVMGFEWLEVERIQCGYNEENKASERICEKVGFHEKRSLRHFQESPSEATRGLGYRAGPVNWICALFHDDPPRLDWYTDIRAAMTILDRNGDVLWTPNP